MLRKIFQSFLFFICCFNLVPGQYNCFTRDGNYGLCVSRSNCHYPFLFNLTPCSRNNVCCPLPPLAPVTRYTTFPQLRPTQKVPETSYTRPSEKYCKQYTRLAYTVSSSGSLLLDEHKVVNTVESENCVLSLSLVVGGEKTKPGEFPHMAALGFINLNDEYNFLCGGSLISDQYVLTAAHCEKAKQSLEIVRLGDQNLNSKDDGAEEINIPIERFIKHELYNSKSRKHDIALVKMRYKIRLHKSIRPACLYPSLDIKETKATATGYGQTEFAGPASEELLKVELPILNQEMCGDAEIDSNQMCAGGEEGKDTCQGDSGGPLQVPIPKNKCSFYIVGITSYGSSYCASSAAVYTRVAAYIDWIEPKVWGNE